MKRCPKHRTKLHKLLGVYHCYTCEHEREVKAEDDYSWKEQRRIRKAIESL